MWIQINFDIVNDKFTLILTLCYLLLNCYFSLNIMFLEKTLNQELLKFCLFENPRLQFLYATKNIRMCHVIYRGFCAPFICFPLIWFTGEILTQIIIPDFLFWKNRYKQWFIKFSFRVRILFFVWACHSENSF